MEKKFKHAYEVDNYTFKNQKDDDFVWELISVLLSMDIEYNPTSSVHELSDRFQDFIVDIGNYMYEKQQRKEERIKQNKKDLENDINESSKHIELIKNLLKIRLKNLIKK